MDSKLRCVFELPGDEDEAMASSQVTTTVASQDPAQDVFSASLQVIAIIKYRAPVSCNEPITTANNNSLFSIINFYGLNS